MRYAVELSYVGNAFSGWQLQPGVPSVQEALEAALSTLDGANVRVTGAGRTDRGVHARGQVASFDLSKEWTPYRLTLALNNNLPDSISVVRASSVPENFDARSSALWREYAYFIWHGTSCYPHIRPMVWWRKVDDWNHGEVAKCCSYLLGRHDFGAFCKLSEKPENCYREILKATYITRGRLSILRIRGTAFLTNMIRIIVGNLDEVGRGRRSPAWFKELLNGGDRTDSSTTAPSSGLFFWRVGYDDF